MTTPLEPPDVSAYTSALARDWYVQTNTDFGGAGPAVWEWVFGLTTVGPTNAPNMVDDGDIYGEGYDSQITTAQAGSLVINGIYKGPVTDGDIVLPAALLDLRSRGKSVGTDNLAQVRYWRKDAIDIAEQAVGAVNWTDGTEDRRGLFVFSCTIVFRGKPTEITKPVTP